MAFLYSQLLFIAFGLTHLAFIQSPSLSRWAPYLLIGAAGFGLLLHAYFTVDTARSKLFANLGAALLRSTSYFYRVICIVAIFFGLRDLSYSSGHLHWNGSTWFILTALLIVTTTALVKDKNWEPGVLPSVVLTNILFIFSFAQYPNFLALTRNIGENIYFSSIAFLITLSALYYLVYQDQKSVRKIKLFGLEYLVFVFLAFRSDNLFSTAGSEYHWSYYIDVIRTVQGGGILLWDTPSQYGFLNILVASSIAKDAWQGLYLLQGALLFVITSVAYYLTSILLKQYSFGRIISFLCALLFFFADPSLIGPQPYPSSSVVRFGPSFLMLLGTTYIHLLHTKLPKPYFWEKLVLALMYVFGSLWSAESWIYCTFILLGFSLAQCMQSTQPSISLALKAILRTLLPSLILSVIALGLIAMLYQIHYGILPDLAMFTMFGKYYSAGFGSYSLKLHSSLLILLIPLILIFNLLFLNTKPEPEKNTVVTIGSDIGALIVIAASIFGWMSYFIGRAVPSNIVAIAPMLIFCFLVTISIIKDLHGGIIKTLLQGCAYVFIVIQLSSILVQPKLITQFIDHSFTSFNAAISTSRKPADDELLELVKSVPHFENQSFVFYGLSGPMPYAPAREGLASGSPWLPQPFALLEEPIPKAIRAEILARYANSHKLEGYILLDIDHHPQKIYQEWLKVLSPYTDCQMIQSGKAYALYQCSSLQTASMTNAKN